MDVKNAITKIVMQEEIFDKHYIIFKRIQERPANAPKSIFWGKALFTHRKHTAHRNISVLRFLLANSALNPGKGFW